MIHKLLLENRFLGKSGKIKENFKFKLNFPEFGIVNSKIPAKKGEKFDTYLFSLLGKNKKAEGGLRTKGYFKFNYKKNEKGWYIVIGDNLIDKVNIEYLKHISNYNELPLITIITVVYNGEKYLEETIKSVINQKYPNIEYIIIDGGSTDKTLDIIKKYEDYIDYYVSESDRGIYDAINKGISLAMGSIIKILNADDTLTENSVEKAVSFFLEKGRGEYFLSSYLNIIDKNSKIIKKWRNKGFTKYFPVFNHPTWYVPLAIYKKYGLYDTTYEIASDYEYFRRLLKNNVKMYMLKEPLVNFRKGGESSGFKGTLEVFKINVKYQNILIATYVFILHFSIKVLGKLKAIFMKL